MGIMEKIVEGNKHRGRGGGGQIVNVLAFYSNDPSSNLADATVCIL